jgi:hypothetical protein
VVGKTDGNCAGLRAPDAAGKLAQLIGGEHQFPDHRNHLLTAFGGHNALPAAHQQGKAVFFLQSRHHPADAGGGISHGLSRRRKTALFNGAKKRPVAFQFHTDLL